MTKHSFTFRTTALAVFCIANAAAGDDEGGGGRVDPAGVAARQKIFGIENVDARTGRVRDDKVILSWITNASFAASVKGRIVLLDTFVTRLEVTQGRTPFVIQDLVDLQPEALFIGHGHFDHADNAAYISKLTGARSTLRPRRARTCSSTRSESSAREPRCPASR